MARTTEPVFRREDRGGIFYAWVPDARTGRSVPRSTGKRTEREAVEWRRRYIRRVEDPKGHASRSVTLKDVLEAFLESRAEKRTLASDTIDFYTSKASMVAAVLGEDTLASTVTPAVVDAYIATRRRHEAKPGKRVSDHTIAKELAVLRASLKLAKRRGKWSGDVEALLPSAGDFSANYDPKASGERALSRQDVAKLMAVMTPAKFAVLAFAVATSAEIDRKSVV